MPSLVRSIGCVLLVASWATAARVALALSPAMAAPASVEIRNGPVPGSLDLRVNETIELSSALSVEQQRADGSFAPVRDLDLGSMKLVTACGQRVGACVTIATPGLRPVPWTGMSCASQCNRTCDKNEPLHGRFRFVVTSCDGGRRFEGDAFELPDEP